MYRRVTIIVYARYTIVHSFRPPPPITIRITRPFPKIITIFSFFFFSRFTKRTLYEKPAGVTSTDSPDPSYRKKKVLFCFFFRHFLVFNFYTLDAVFVGPSVTSSPSKNDPQAICRRPNEPGYRVKYNRRALSFFVGIRKQPFKIVELYSHYPHQRFSHFSDE